MWKEKREKKKKKAKEEKKAKGAKGGRDKRQADKIGFFFLSPFPVLTLSLEVLLLSLGTRPFKSTMEEVGKRYPRLSFLPLSPLSNVKI